jgi:hypothetical protein
MPGTVDEATSAIISCDQEAMGDIEHVCTAAVRWTCSSCHETMMESLQGMAWI